jgi:hypothetical protein
VSAFQDESFRTAELSALESQILEEKAKGLSDLEVESRLFLYEREVRAIARKLKRRYVNGQITNPPNSNGSMRMRSLRLP